MEKFVEFQPYFLLVFYLKLLIFLGHFRLRREAPAQPFFIICRRVVNKLSVLSKS